MQDLLTVTIVSSDVTNSNFFNSKNSLCQETGWWRIVQSPCPHKRIKWKEFRMWTGAWQINQWRDFNKIWHTYRLHILLYVMSHFQSNTKARAGTRLKGMIGSFPTSGQRTEHGSSRSCLLLPAKTAITKWRNQQEHHTQERVFDRCKTCGTTNLAEYFRNSGTCGISCRNNFFTISIN